MRWLRGFLKVALRALNGLGLDWRPSRSGEAGCWGGMHGLLCLDLGCGSLVGLDDIHQHTGRARD